MKRRVSMFVAAHFLIGCSGPEPAESKAVASVASSILGGRVDDDRGAVMALERAIDDSYALCTATVIHVGNRSALLLTAAHCVAATDENGDVRSPVEPLPPSQLHVTPNSDAERDQLLERQYPVVSVAVAPGYNGILGNPNDLAVVRIVGATADLARAALLSNEDVPLTAGENVTLVGFGQTLDPADSVRRRSTTQSIAWLNEQFVGFDQSGGRGLCQGDSGGPVLVTRDGAEVIAAVNSLAKGTAEASCVANGTSVQTRRHAAFIAEAIAALPVQLDCESCTAAEQAPGNACAPASTCQGECGELLACLDACDERICFTGCVTAFPTGLAQYRTVRAESASCATARCSETCRLAEQGAGGVEQVAAGASGEASSGAASGGVSGTATVPATRPPPRDASGDCSLSKRSNDNRQPWGPYLFAVAVWLRRRPRSRCHARVGTIVRTLNP